MGGMRLKDVLHDKKKKIKKSILGVKKRRGEKPERLYYHFLPIDKKKIVFDSYMGQGYSDNPQAIAQEILRQKLHYDLVFLTREETVFPEGIRQVKYGSREAMKELATAKMWIFNSRVVRHPTKRSGQVYLHTWHGGYPLKLIEKQAEKKLDDGYLSLAKKDGKITDAVISSSRFLSQIYLNEFWLEEKAEILEFGTPKNDVLFDEDYKKRVDCSIRKKYGIPKDARVVLYFPTFRNDGSLSHYDLDYKRVIDAFEKLYGQEVFLLVRFHPNLVYKLGAEGMKAFDYDKVFNVTDYPEANDFYCMADCMISDYSGVMVGFALQGKPLFIYAGDIDSYLVERGFNELYDKLPCKKCKTNEELINEIAQYNDKEYKRKLNDLFESIGTFDKGDASKQTVEWIKNKIG